MKLQKSHKLFCGGAGVPISRKQRLIVQRSSKHSPSTHSADCAAIRQYILKVERMQGCQQQHDVTFGGTSRQFGAGAGVTAGCAEEL
jgi:hypothetical protein